MAVEEAYLLIGDEQLFDERGAHGIGVKNAKEMYGIHPKLYEQNRVAVTRGKFLIVEGVLQNQDGVISVKASAVRVLQLSEVDMQSHDFH